MNTCVTEVGELFPNGLSLSASWKALIEDKKQALRLEKECG